MHIQEKMERKIQSLIDQGHIVKLEKCSDQQFIRPVVIMVKKDHSIKLAMDSKQILKMIHKNMIHDTCKQVEWLGEVVNEYGTIPMQRKTEAILKLQNPTTFKEIKS